MDRNFISTNIHGCIELNGHGLISFHNRCRDSGHPEQFLPTLTGSQICESGFRTFRSMSTTRCSIIGFDMHDMLGKAKRLDVLSNISENEKKYNFKGKKKQNYFIPNILLSDDEIQQVVESGCKNVVKDFKQFGYNGKPGFPMVNLSELRPLPVRHDPETQNFDELDDLNREYNLDLDLAQNDERTEEDEQEIAAELAKDSVFMHNLEYLLELEHGHKNKPGELLCSEGESQPGFLDFRRGDTTYTLRKSSIIWMLDDSDKKVSSDRLHRFIDQDRETRSDRISLGEIIVIKNHNDREIVGQVLGFSIPGQKSMYKGFSCGINTLTEVMVLINTFKLIGGKLVPINQPAAYHSNKNYIRHVKFQRNVRTNEISMAE